MAVKRTLWVTENRNDSYRGYIRSCRNNGRKDFHIRKMKNVTRFKVGTFLSEDQVESLINQLGWDIIVEGRKK